MLEGLFDRNHDYRRRLLAVDSKTPLQDRIDADPGPTVDPIGFVRPGDQEDQCDARVLHHVLDATTATGYKLRGTVGPQGELEMHVVAPPNSSNAGSAPIDLVVNGTIDGSGTVRARQISHSCSYDFVWQK
jgi:hypothetical protein